MASLIVDYHPLNFVLFLSHFYVGYEIGKAIGGGGAEFVLPIMLMPSAFTEHMTDLFPWMFALDQIAVGTTFLITIYGIYKQLGEAKNKTLVKVVSGLCFAIMGLMKAWDSPAVPQDAYEDRVAQLNTNAYVYGHVVLHALLIIPLIVANSTPKVASTEKKEA